MKVIQSITSSIQILRMPGIKMSNLLIDVLNSLFIIWQFKAKQIKKECLMEEPTPYQAPNTSFVANAYADEYEEIEMAGRGSRLLAAIVDSTFFFIPALLFLSPIIVDVINNGGRISLSEESVNNRLLIVGAILTVISIVNIYLLVKYAQTIGKKILKIQIARSSGEQAGFWRIFLLRGLVTGVLLNILSAIVGVIPVVGLLLSLIVGYLLDPLLIFRESQQCLHDQIADTIVIKC